MKSWNLEIHVMVKPFFFHGVCFVFSELDTY